MNRRKMSVKAVYTIVKTKEYQLEYLFNTLKCHTFYVSAATDEINDIKKAVT